MSLRERVIALVGLVLALSLAGYVALTWRDARRDLGAELAAAQAGGVQTVRSAFEDLPRSDHPARDLRQLVATFDGNRHLRVALLDRDGQIRLASHVAAPRYPAPDWFTNSLGISRAAVLLPVPLGSGDTLELRPEPASDSAALWRTSSAAIALFAFAAAVALALIYQVIGRALRPLADLSRGLALVGNGKVGERITEAGPPELRALQNGFNAMAERLAETDAQNCALQAQLRTIQDEERADIARDLHDEIGPHLFAVSLDADIIARSLDSGKPELVREQLRSIQSAVTYMQRQVRELIARLRPTQATELGLEAALAELVASWQARQPEVVFETSLVGADALAPAPIHDVIYRVVQEAIANALKHAETSHISVRLEGVPGAVLVRIGNHGTVRPVRRTGPGLGLLSMRERVRETGGTLLVTQAAEGWTVLARFAIDLRESAVA